MKFYPGIVFGYSPIGLKCPACKTQAKTWQFAGPVYYCHYCFTTFLQSFDGLYELKKESAAPPVEEGTKA